jgi:hypothetical protein
MVFALAVLAPAKTTIAIIKTFAKFLIINSSFWKILLFCYYFIIASDSPVRGFQNFVLVVILQGIGLGG